MHDVIVIGAGPAGLQAALTLGRVHRTCLVLDSGSYRNDPAAEMHNFLGRDGTPPDELRRDARKDLSRYATVEIIDAGAQSVVPTQGGGFTVTTSAGSTHAARRIILATGLRDVLPDVPGIAELWGTVVAHCPFCHGHELAGRTIGLQGGPHTPRMAGMLSRIAGRLVVLANGHEFVDAELAQLDRFGAEVHHGRVMSLEAEGSGANIELDDGSSVLVDGYFVAGTLEQSAPFAHELALTLLASGCVEVDPFGRTSLSGVYAAGDLAHQADYPMPLASVLAAAAAGQLAGVAAVQDQVTDDSSFVTQMSPVPARPFKV